MNGKSKKAEYRAANSAELSSGYAKLSKKTAASARGLVIFAAVFIFVADIFALSVMLYQKLGFPELLYPSILIVTDGLFLLFALVTNFRFRYSKALLGCYFTLAAVLSALFLWEGNVAERTYFTYLGIGIYIVPHVLMWLALGWTSRLAKNPKFSKRKTATVAAIALVLVASAGFGVLRMEYGTFGQNDMTERAVVYRLNETGDAYVAADVLNGRGTSVTVAETFNGKTVEGVDCALFSNEEIRSVNIRTTKPFVLYDPELLQKKNPAIRVTVNREAFGGIQSQVFSEAKEKKDNAIGDFLKQIVPDVSDDEVFVTFSYDFETLPEQAEAIPAYIGDKNAVFQAENLGAEYRNLYERRDDLEWNYFSNGRQRLKTFAQEEGVFAVGQTLRESVRNVTVAFERVYSVERSYGAYRYGGEWVSSLYATESEIGESLQYERAGCTANWSVSASGAQTAIISTEAEFSEYLSGLGDVGTVSLTANWSVVKPVFEVFSDAEDNTFTYGDDVTVSARAQAHPLKTEYRIVSADGASVIETWKEEPRFSMSGLVPKESGTFTVTARAIDAYDDRLFAERSETITLTVKKKTLEFDWSFPENAEYDGAIKNVSAACRAGQAVGSDRIEYALSETVKNAKTYRLSVNLSGETKEKYQVSETTGRTEYTVTPKTVTVLWNDAVYVYDGTVQTPTASANGVPADGAIDVTVSGGGRNAGDYVAKAITSDGNYRLTNAEKSFTVKQREVTAVWSAENFVYNGRVQHPTVADVVNAVQGETSTLIPTIVLSGGNAVNAGAGYTVTATLPAASNYRFASEQIARYEISKADLTVKAENREKVYDGKTYADFAVTAAGLAETDALSEVLNVSYGGAAAASLDAGVYEIVTEVTAAEKYGNYTVTRENGVLTIRQRPITVTGEQKTKTYDNKIFADFSVTVSNLADGDALSDVGTVSYSGAALLAVAASEVPYDYSPEIAESARGAKYGNYAVSFQAGSLTILKKELLVETFGGVKTYDGAPFTAFTYNTSALADGDNLGEIAAFGFAGTAFGAVNAGQYPVVAEITKQGSKFGNYEFRFVSGSVQIQPRALTIAAKNAEKIYDNARYSFGEADYDVTGLAATDSLSEVLSVAFAGAGVNGISGGTYSYELSANETFGKYGNYNVTFRGAELTIKKRAVTVSAVDKEKTYDGKVFAEFSVTAELQKGDTLAALGKITYAGAAVSAIDASDTPYEYLPKIETGDRGAKFDTCYSVTFASATLRITKRDAAITAENIEKVYDGKGFEGFTFRTENLAQGDTADELSTFAFGGGAVAAVDAGSYSLTVSVQTPAEKYENYNLRFVSGTAAIFPRTLTLHSADIAPEISKIYDGTTDCGFEFLFGTHFMLDGADIAGEITGVEIRSKVYDSPNVSDATKITVTFGELLTGAGYKAGNYTYASGGSLEYRAAITAFETVVTWTGTSFVYTGAPQKPAAAATGIDGQALTLTVSGNGTSGGAVNAGSYRASASCSDRNYKLLDSEVAFEITPAVIAIVWSAQTEFEYTGASVAPQATATGVNGEAVSLTVKVKSGSGYAEAVNVGTYTAVSETDNPNYSLTNTEREFAIVPKTVEVVWGNLSFEYSGSAVAPQASAAGVNGEAVSLTVKVKSGSGYAEAVNVGTYTAVSETDNPNYSLTNTEREFAIVPKAVEVVWGNLSFEYSGSAVAPQASAAGVNGEAIAVTVKVKSGSGYAEAVNVGTYTAVSETDNPNYSLTNAEREFRVVPKAVAVIWGNLSAEYNGAEQTPTAKVALLSGEQTLAVGFPAGVTGKDAGTYEVAASLSDGNYRLTDETKQFTILPKTVAVVWNGEAEYAYDGEAHAPSAAVSGVNGETVAIEISLVRSGAETVTEAVEAGTYTASVSTNNGNYRLTGAEFEFKIVVPAAVNVSENFCFDATEARKI